MPKRRIGFVDHDLNNFHADIYLRHVRDELAGRGFEVAGCTATLADAGRAWAAKNAVPYYDDAAALDAHVDAYAVLAPSDPETHLALCEAVFPAGKPTYVDKTFAPDAATAERIFALADRYGVPMQTTSALRYTAVQAAAAAARDAGDPLRHMVAWGAGRSFGEYAIHPVELVVSCLGPEATRLMRRGTGRFEQLLIDFSGGRTAAACLCLGQDAPFAATLVTETRTRHLEVDTGRLFIDMAAAMLDLFETGRVAIDRRESLAIRRILDAAEDPAAREGFVAI